MSDKKKKDYVVNADGSVSVKIDDKNITIREPVVRDMMAMDEVTGEKQQEVSLLANLTGLTQDEICSLTLKKYQKLQGVLKSFL